MKICAYQGLALGKESASPATEEEVVKETERILKQSAADVEKEGEAENGNIVTIDFEGFVDGVAFEGGKGENYDLELGSGTFIPGFEDQLIGAKKDREVEVHVTFPENYPSEELKGKAAVFKCKVHAVKEKVEPTLDDEFARKQGFENVEEFKKALEDQLNRQKQKETNMAYISKICDHLAEESDIELETEKIDARIREILSYYEQSIASYGMTLENYLQAMNMTREVLTEQLRPEAEKSLKIDAIYDYIANEEKIELTEEEIERELEYLKSYYRLSDEQISAFRAEKLDALKRDIIRQKVSEFLIDRND